MFNLDSLFVEFYNEKYNGEIFVVNFNNKAFISYSIDADKMHLWELFIRKPYRKTFLIGSIVNRTMELAKAHNCSQVFGYVEESHKSPESIIKLMKKLEFSLLGIDNNRAVFSKSI